MADFDDSVLKIADVSKKYADNKQFGDWFLMFRVEGTYVPNFMLIGSLPKMEEKGPKNSLRGDFFNVGFNSKKHVKICPASQYWIQIHKWKQIVLDVEV